MDDMDVTREVAVERGKDTLNGEQGYTVDDRFWSRVDLRYDGWMVGWNQG